MIFANLQIVDILYTPNQIDALLKKLIPVFIKHNLYHKDFIDLSPRARFLTSKMILSIIQNQVCFENISWGGDSKFYNKSKKSKFGTSYLRHETALHLIKQVRFNLCTTETDNKKFKVVTMPLQMRNIFKTLGMKQHLTKKQLEEFKDNDTSIVFSKDNVIANDKVINFIIQSKKIEFNNFEQDRLNINKLIGINEKTTESKRNTGSSRILEHSEPLVRSPGTIETKVPESNSDKRLGLDIQTKCYSTLEKVITNLSNKSNITLHEAFCRLENCDKKYISDMCRKYKAEIFDGKFKPDFDYVDDHDDDKEESYLSKLFK